MSHHCRRRPTLTSYWWMPRSLIPTLTLTLTLALALALALGLGLALTPSLPLAQGPRRSDSAGWLECADSLGGGDADDDAHATRATCRW